MSAFLILIYLVGESSISTYFDVVMLVCLRDEVSPVLKDFWLIKYCSTQEFLIKKVL